MSEGKPKKLVRFSEEILDLHCEYEDCNVSQKIMDCFTDHIYDSHLSKLTESNIHCHWRDCEALAYSLPELRRHILFHAHHTKIKCYGRNVQVRQKLPGCTLGSQSRNLIPELPDPFVCSWNDCSENFENPESFYNHLDDHISSSCTGKKVWKCLWLGCERHFPEVYKLKDHVRSHSQEKTVACPVCGATFASRTKFIDHVMKQIPISDEKSEEVFTCEYCRRTLPTERLLKDHVRIHVCHYKCPFCDMTCTTPSSLRQHITYRHSDTKSHSCLYCDFKCKRQGDLRKHLETHSEIPQYSCPREGCTYAVRSKTSLKNHLAVKHGSLKQPQYMCHICSKVTTRGNYLTKHMLSKHDIRWPSGHSRFRYRLDEDGYYRLQTVRYESVELSEAMLSEQNDKDDVDDPSVVSDAENDGGILGQTAPSKLYISQFPPSELDTADPSAVPLALYVENEKGTVSVNTVALKGEVNDLVLVTPDGKEVGKITVQVVNDVSATRDSSCTTTQTNHSK